MSSKFEYAAIPQIQGAYLFDRKMHRDDRGSFAEIYREGELTELIGARFVQANQSFSYQNVLRGLHIQKNNPQGKLINCLYGEVLDVMLDLRPDSPTFLKSFSVHLGFTSGMSVYVPPGCAHGFLSLSRFSVLHYNCTTIYDAESDGGVRWDSPEVVDQFGRMRMWELSPKDAILPTVQEYLGHQPPHAIQEQTDARPRP